MGLTKLQHDLISILFNQVDKTEINITLRRLTKLVDKSPEAIRKALNGLVDKSIIHLEKGHGRTPNRITLRLTKRELTKLVDKSDNLKVDKNTESSEISTSRESQQSLQTPLSVLSPLPKKFPTKESPPPTILRMVGKNIYNLFSPPQNHSTGETQPFFKKTGGELIPRSIEEATTAEEKVLVVGKEYQTKNPGGLFSPKNIMNELNLSFGEVAEILTQLLASKKVFQYQPGGWGVV